MRKIIVIIGEANSGKTFMSNTMAKAFQNPYFLDGNDNFDFEGFWLDGFCLNNDALIIDDLPKEKLRGFVFMLYDEIDIHTRFKPTITLEIPNVIININSDLESLPLNDPSLKRRIKLIQTSILKQENGSKMFHSYTVKN